MWRAHPWCCKRSSRQKSDFGRAVSRVLSSFLRTERIICLSSQYPKPVPLNGTWSGQLRGFLFGLAPDGVFRASAIALGAVGSYPAFSPLPAAETAGGLFSVALSVERFLPFSRVYPCPAARLRGIAPYGARTFLPRLAPEAILRPSKTGTRIRRGCWKIKLFKNPNTQ